MITIASRLMHLPERYGTLIGMISFDGDSVIAPKCSAKLSSFYASRLVTLRTLDSRGFRLNRARLCLGRDSCA